tara:strand:+ start:2602 stop:2802 length:201 start_codon:yes stop_codon:yes gene_type:complete
MGQIKKAWLTTTQAADYLGVSKRSLASAITLKKMKMKNHDLVLKDYGNRTLIKLSSLEKIEKIETK